MQLNEKYSSLRSMTNDDLNLVFNWRNHPDVRSCMFHQHVISLSEHQQWYQNRTNDPAWHLLIYEYQNSPQGFISLNTDSNLLADWGFYKAPSSVRGIGGLMGIEVLDYAFDKLNLHKVNGQVLASNDDSKKFHLKLGFQQEGILRDSYLNESGYHDVWHFGLLKHEWQKNRI